MEDTKADILGHEPLWSTAALATYLDLPIQTLYAWRSRGDGPPAIRVGRHLRFRPEAVANWLQSRQEAEGLT